MQMIDINNRYSHNELLFKHLTPSLYDLMYDRSQDFVLNQMFNNLYIAQKERCIKQLLEDDNGPKVEYLKIDKEQI